LALAASIQNLTYDAGVGRISFRIQNQTGHKLISGFAEGRRMFVNVKAYASGGLIYEVNPYDAAAGTLRGLGYPYLGMGLPNPQPLGPNEAYVDELVYEMHPSSSLTGEQETFHFALADGRYKDNRIPPKGFRIAQADGRQSVPVWHGLEDPGYFSAPEYAGGYDEVNLTDYGVSIPGADYVEVRLYYQTTSREYIEFLRDEINGTGNLTLSGTGAGGDPPYIVQSDPFFAQLKAWGDTIWQLWDHNKGVPGAAPFLMTQSSFVPPSQPVVRLTTAEQAVPESVGQATVTAELTAPTGVTVTVPYSVSGTATGGGVDHDLADGEFEIPPGSSSATLTFDVVDDEVVEGDETMVVTLGAPSYAELGEPDVQTITIQDNDQVPVVRLTMAEQTVSEGVGQVTVTAELTATTGVTVTAPYTVSGTATGGGVDHDLADGEFEIPPGSSSASVTFSVVDDDLVEGNETVVVTLGAPSYATLGEPDAQTITIQDNDQVPVVRLMAAERTVSEGVGQVTVPAELTATTGVTVTAPYTVSGTATGGGVDHDLADGGFEIPPGSSSASVTFSVVDDEVVEGDETVVVTLGAPSNATLGEPDVQTITIQDNDQVPVVRLTTAEQTVSEGVGQVTVTAELTATTGATVTAPYSVSGTATGGGVDHDLADGEFEIPPGSSSASVTFSVVDDDAMEDNETAVVTLGVPSNATLGEPDVQTITIADDDFLVPVPPSNVIIRGPITGVIQVDHSFTAAVEPMSTTLPITYVWQATEFSAVTVTAGLSHVMSFTWTFAGEKVIALTVSNGFGGPVTATRRIEIELSQAVEQYHTYLPVVFKRP
jgi:hypothetical protein